MKKALGFLAVVSASVMLMCASAYAATTYAVSTVAGEAGNTVEVPVTVTSDTTTDQINGYVITFKYDPAKVTPVASAADQGAGAGLDASGAACYATAGANFANGIIVADSIDNTDGTKTLAVAWAAADPVVLTQDELTQLADVDFQIADGVTENVTLEVQTATVAVNSTDAPADIQVASGAIELTSIIYGDVDNNGSVTTYDGSLAYQYALGLISLDDAAIVRANVDGNESITTYDGSLIYQYALGLLDKFPVEG